MKLNLKTFVEKEYTVKHVTYEPDETKDDNLNVLIGFHETSMIMMLSACSECCDVNVFQFPNSLAPLIGSRIVNIQEDSGESKCDQYESVIAFKITIQFDHSHIINELMKSNNNWKKLPNDIVKLISNMLHSEVTFYRQNSSNGYYSGYFDITFKE